MAAEPSSSLGRAITHVPEVCAPTRKRTSNPLDTSVGKVTVVLYLVSVEFTVQDPAAIKVCVGDEIVPCTFAVVVGRNNSHVTVVNKELLSSTLSVTVFKLNLIASTDSIRCST